MKIYRSRSGISINEGGERGMVFVCLWAGPLAFFLDIAVRIPLTWVGFGLRKWRPYVRCHRTGTWEFA
jgi:hypothetical protein